jgi:hypothetical protein
MTDFERLLAALVSGGVEFVVIGGMAATAHGSAHITVDLDIVYHRTSENIARLADALSPLQPYLRGAPPGLPFRFDADTINRGLNFTLVTAERAAGRPKDLERIAELESIHEDRGKM